MKKLLIVDDEVDLLTGMELLLTRIGYKTKTATSYKTLLPIVYSFLPDIIILDVMLGKEDGRMICKELKNNPITKDICIMLFSASPEKGKNYQDYLADGWLDKPFDNDSIASKLDSLCTNKLSKN